MIKHYGRIQSLYFENNENNSNHVMDIFVQLRCLLFKLYIGFVHVPIGKTIKNNELLLNENCLCSLKNIYKKANVRW